jgi:hypothetical protein
VILVHAAGPELLIDFLSGRAVAPSVVPTSGLALNVTSVFKGILRTSACTSIQKPRSRPSRARADSKPEDVAALCHGLGRSARARAADDGDVGGCVNVVLLPTVLGV